ncbi:hypothetical protein MTO96_031568 [Rhipicephalus appendiculatus]
MQVYLKLVAYPRIFKAAMFALCRQALRRALVSPTLAPTSGLPAGPTLLANNFSVAASLCKLQEDWFMPAPKRWPKKNDEIEPPQEPGQPRNQAWVVHYRNQIRYSPKKMLPIAQMIRGMSVDEAIKQLTFVHRKGAKIVIEVLKEAQEMAVRDHNVEFKSNLWVGESFLRQGGHRQGRSEARPGKTGHHTLQVLSLFCSTRRRATTEALLRPPH